MLIRIGQRGDVTVVFFVSGVFSVLVLRNRQQGRQSPMVRVFHTEDSSSLSVDSCHPQSQIIGLRARIHKSADFQLLRKHGDKSFAQIDHVFMQISGVCVQSGQLFIGDFRDPRVAVPHMRNVVVRIQIFVTFVRCQVLHFSFYETHRLCVCH